MLLLHAVTVQGVRSNQPDLTARQLAVFLTVYLDPTPQNVRGLADTLNVSKPAITRALDRLGQMGLTSPAVDPQDRRSVLVRRTVRGASYLSALRHGLADAARECAA
nr:MarR family transcriptional regulator [Falsiroseomonas frigidaquae]